MYKQKPNSKMQCNRAGVGVGVTGNGRQKARRFVGPSTTASHASTVVKTGARGEASGLFCTFQCEIQGKQAVRGQSG